MLERRSWTAQLFGFSHRVHSRADAGLIQRLTKRALCALLNPRPGPLPVKAAIRAAPVNAPVAPWFHVGRAWRRVTEQGRWLLKTRQLGCCHLSTSSKTSNG